MLNFALCDDNPMVLKNLSKKLESIFIQYNLDAEIVFKTRTPSDLLNYINKYTIDVLFLDIELNDKLNGIDIARILREHNNDCYIIFVTAHMEYALIAYKYKAFDYLCKSLEKEVLSETVLRLFDDAKQHTFNHKFIRFNKNTLINENQVQYIKCKGSKLTFYTDNHIYSIYSSLNKLQHQLPDNFVRCNKSSIANINNIIRLEPKDNLIYFKNNVACNIGPTYKKNFLKEVTAHEL